jgi:hypothetical protein
MGIQNEFDLREEIQKIGDELNRIPKAIELHYLLQ